MSDAANTVSVTILDKSFKIKCPPEKIAELKESAQYLDTKMREISQGGKLLSLDRISVIAALNITHELLLQKRQTNQYIDAMNKRLQDLQNKIDAVIDKE